MDVDFPPEAQPDINAINLSISRLVTDFRMPKLGFGRRGSAEVLDGALGKWSLDSAKPGFAPSLPRASDLLSWGSRFLASPRSAISHELQLSNREA